MCEPLKKCSVNSGKAQFVLVGLYLNFYCVFPEVAVLCRLRHPCVVCLLGVSLHPLCFVLELAPLGSLASVIDELSAKREERAKQYSNFSGNRASILGRQVSYKIAFQASMQIKIFVRLN